jgi:glycosyltransferase involved in cell wall biosynthesis
LHHPESFDRYQDMKSLITFVFVGRLTREKGFDLVIDLAKRAQQHHADRIRFFVFGDGPLRSDLLSVMESCPAIHYFWRKPLHEIINRYLPGCQYALMPSRFLETFGLSACEMLMTGIPVIGPAQWWLEPFIPKPFNTLDYSWSEDKQLQACVAHVIEHHTPVLRKHYSEQALKTSLSYDSDTRLARFQELSKLPLGSKVLLVSDFLDHVGWIESYVHNVAMLLRQHGYQVELFGRSFGGKVPAWLKLFGIARSVVNLRDAWRLATLIKKSNPDLIWTHSISRRLGWWALRAWSRSSALRWHMIHDFGLYLPFPHRLTKVSQLPLRVSLQQRRRSGSIWSSWIKTFISLPFITGKYLSVYLIRRMIRARVDLIVVPSSYMLHSTRSLAKPVAVETLTHFVMIKEPTDEA